ncbi:MAG TPA: hypothetical protein DCY07_08155, partial [Rhodospirillaceae bacterium]|nr:hypothetical protein [Rhodospirillaceae bacterium]
PRGVALIAAEPISLSEIATSISGQTGIPVRVAAGLSGGLGEGESGTGSMDGKMVIAYEGSLSGLLDVVSGNFGISWRYDGGTIRLSRFETRVFVVEALPGTQKIKDGMKEDTSSSSSSSGGGGGGGSSLEQSSSMDVELKVWDELRDTLTSILGGVGTVVTSPSSGTATVTTTPELMGTVAKFIEEENARLAQQIAINVEIYTVSLADNTDFNVTFDTALKQLSSAFEANVTGLTNQMAGSAASKAANFNVAVLDPEKTGSITSIFSALSTIGDTTRVSQFPLTTLNNRTVSRRVGRDISYVESLSNTESTGSSFSSSTVTPGTVREGFSLQLTPRLLQDGRILMQYSFSLVDLIELVNFPTGSGNVQLPETSTRVFVQQAMLKNGSTLIIGGHDDERVTQSSRGVGNAYNYFLGGGSENAKSRAMMFIAITPQVLGVQRAEQE